VDQPKNRFTLHENVCILMHYAMAIIMHLRISDFYDFESGFWNSMEEAVPSATKYYRTLL